ncbi:uncharacterized protein K444DRAFT_371198 [Hyaloscypha bicolor E]|uniref:Uncharacterized protein n=1 Tax=Hyaloscypha bicolor E TaxID=1095630 RepID=A0A2J6TEP4_9HELO|nr:uncharacterized protein K444DRAFT_371198 [Hyaloscypha bicolor E]PMD61469.1 hypothetical protein K444DRAFT_371198 [Hyaloscypha bicolor E]
MAPKRELLKGPVCLPEPQLRATSYTQKPASKDEVSVRTGKEPDIPVIEFSFQTPKPFLDPSIIQRRVQAEKQWKAEQEKKQKSEAGPSQGA